MLSSERKAVLEMLIRGRPPTKASASAGPRVEPASYAQRRLWFIEQLQQDHSPYTLHSLQELNWPVDPQLLETAINLIVQRHEILRTTFTVQNGEPVQKISAVLHLPLQYADLRQLAVGERTAEVTRRIAELIGQRFSLEEGPLFRTALIKTGEQNSLFLVVAHHIVFDGPSFPLLFAELESTCRQLTDGQQVVSSPHLQYADFARKQRALLSPQKIEKEVKFWRKELEGVEKLELPQDRKRPRVPSFQGAIYPLAVPPSLCARLRELASRHQTTLFTVLLAGAAAALSRICRQEDFALGIPVTGRDAPEFRNSIGFFVDTVVVRCGLQENPTLQELVDRCRRAVLRSLAHRALPFEMLVERLQPPRAFGANPIFQVGFQLMHQEGPSTDPRSTDFPRGAMFDLGFNLWGQGEGLGGRLEFSSELFDPSTVEMIGSVFYQCLKALASPNMRLSEIPLISQASPLRPSVLQGECFPIQHRSIMELIEEIALRYPEALAVDGAGGQLKYGELMAHIALLGARLIPRGATPAGVIVLVLPRSLELICFELAVWRIGATFVLIDPSWPENRKQRVIQASDAQIVVDERLARELLREESISHTPVVLGSPEHAAYVIYTSGSTGEPKGVVLEHKGLINVALAQRQLFQLAPGRRLAQLASPSFDASIFELVMALVTGATLVIAPPELLAGDELASFLKDKAVDTIVVPPSLLATIRPSAVPNLRLICVAGENCPPDLAQEWKEREFWNLYGPTETTIWATFGRGEIGGRVPIGRTISNTTAIVMDSSLRPVPVGVAGELCVAGVGVARGYYRQPEMTAERFVADQLGKWRRMYRTGDLVRQCSIGELIFLGRVDRQVKIRGFRIEPEEIEVVLRRLPAIADVVVAVKPINGSEPQLVAYLRPENSAMLSLDDCRRHARDHLPHYMVPAHFLPVDEFPRTPGGKVDLAALVTSSEIVSGNRELLPPSTDTERLVAEWFAQVTHRPCVNADDDFFALGGHSLAAAHLVANARAALKIELKIRDVFFNATVRALASRIDELVTASDGGEEEDVPLVALSRISSGDRTGGSKINAEAV